MSDFQVEGQALKKLLKIAKKTPLPFGFNPSPKVADCYLAMHRKKPAKLLGKDAKDEGQGAKSAFGTVKVEKKLLILQCERVVPNLAKIFKKYLKLQKVTLNIEVRDASGAVLEADIEDDLPDDPEMADEDDQAEDSGDQDGPDKAALSQRLAALHKRIEALDPKVGKKFSGPFAKVVGLFKKNDFERCLHVLDKLETALPEPGDAPAADPALLKLAELHKQFLGQAAKILDEAKRLNIEKALAQAGRFLEAAKAPEAKTLLVKIRDALKKALDNNAPEAPDPKAAKLATLAKNYRDQLARVTDETQNTAIDALLILATDEIKAGDFDKATAALTKARDALKAGILAANQAKDTPPAEEAEGESTGAQKQAWEKVDAELADKINTALSKGLVADVDGLRKNWNWAVSNAADGKYAEALAAIPAVRKLLGAESENAFAEDVPEDAKPFAESRMRWSAARSKMQSEMEKLKASISASVKGDDELSKAVAGGIWELTKHLEKLDSRLEDKLDKIVNEASGAKRDGFKSEAQSLIAEYRKELATDFFQDVDTNSGFGNVAVMATAQSALGAIEKVLI